MSSYVSAELRRIVEARATRACEYCLIHERDTYLGIQVDHIVSEKHGGLTSADNLCCACAVCNRNKGSDIGSIVAGNDEFVRFYNPRRDAWADHFQISGASVDHKTTIGLVTARILGFNTTERLLEREALIQVGRYPSPEAKRLTSRGREI